MNEQTNPDETSPAVGRSDSNVGLGVGSRLAVDWGCSICTARIIAKTEQRYLLKMDWGGKEVMDIDELRRRKFVQIPERLPFWKRWFTPNVKLTGGPTAGGETK